MFGFFKKISIRLLTSVVVNVSSYTKCASLSNQKCEIQPTLINLHLNEYSQELHYYPFSVKLDRFFGSCDNLKVGLSLSKKIVLFVSKENLLK